MMGLMPHPEKFWSTALSVSRAHPGNRNEPAIVYYVQSLHTFPITVDKVLMNADMAGKKGIIL
jgi:hypothetical protein